MRPVSPVVPGYEEHEIVFGKDQPEYQPLPTLGFNEDGQVGVISRWRFTWRERLRVLFGADVFLYVKTFGAKLQPVMVAVDRPSIDESPIPEKVEIAQPTGADVVRFSKGGRR